MASKRSGGTPPEELEKLEGRVMAAVKMDEVFSRQDMIDRLTSSGDQGKVIGTKTERKGRNYNIGRNAAEILVGDDNGKIVGAIQDNLRSALSKELPPEDYISDTEEKELIRDARGAYKDEAEKEVMRKAEDLAEEKIRRTLESKKPSKEDLDVVASEAVGVLWEVPGLQFLYIKEAAEFTKKLAQETERPSNVGIYMREDALTKILESFNKPKSSTDVALDLRKESPGFRKEVGVGTIARDIRRLNLIKNGYTKAVKLDSKGKVLTQELTPKGRELLKKLRR